MWLMLWLGINTGPWIFKKEPKHFIDWLHYIRTTFPFFVLPICTIAIIAKPLANPTRPNQPIRLWFFYGMLGLAACTVSPQPLNAAYWALSYLSVVVFCMYYNRSEAGLGSAVSLNHITWIITTGFLLLLLFYARADLFQDYRYGITGYGVTGRIQTIFNTAMSRSSGLARFGAVPGIVSLVFLMNCRGIFRIFWAVPFTGSAAMVYFMQSRGALIGFAFAVFIIFLMRPKTRRAGVILLLALGISFFFNLIPERRFEQVTQHIIRGQDEEGLRTMTGRTYTWKKAWGKIKQSPFIGWGPQADRYLFKEHTHNAYLYAFLTSGIIGVIAFSGALIWVWILVFRILRHGIAEKLGHQIPFLQTSGILAFFMIRSIPEASGAMYGVDLMVMVPAMAYIGILGVQTKSLVDETE